MTNLALIILHAGPHNPVEWLIYAILLGAVIAVGVMVARDSRLDLPWDRQRDPRGGKRRRRDPR
ncbi:MAG TPA: hypothetical protein VIA82_05660 [Candidatus Limnocylindria bacterium]|jgi:hypothetical protein